MIFFLLFLMLRSTDNCDRIKLSVRNVHAIHAFCAENYVYWDRKFFFFFEILLLKRFFESSSVRMFLYFFFQSCPSEFNNLENHFLKTTEISQLNIDEFEYLNIFVGHNF